jgi:hypothetical protein
VVDLAITSIKQSQHINKKIYLPEKNSCRITNSRLCSEEAHQYFISTKNDISRDVYKKTKDALISHYQDKRKGEKQDELESLW